MRSRSMGKKRKRCSKGKSCGATCIENRKMCLVNAADSLSISLTKTSGMLGRKEVSPNTVKSVNKPPSSNGNEGQLGGVAPVPNNPKPVPGKPVLEKGNIDQLGIKELSQGGKEKNIEVEKQLEGKAKKNVDRTLKELSDSSTKPINVDGVMPADKVNWNAGREDGAKFLASGAYGSFIIVPANNLANGLETKVSGEVGIKYGIVTPKEVGLLKEIGEAGAGPRVIAARTGDKRGVIAMEVIPGKTIDALIDEGKMSKAQISDAYLRAFSKIHRIGISHGDTHYGNVIIQPNGVGKLIDLGFADRSPRKALLEALSIATGEGGGVAKIMADNLSKIIKDLGRDDITDPLTLRLNLSTVFSKDKETSDKEIMDFINQLYQGV
jgi:serine/threonine protein kinase